MKKTVTITIGGSLFHIEEDAYRGLDAYLASIRSHFAGYDDAEEIVSDIEGRIAEEFTDLLKTGHRAAVNDVDVETVCANMGTTEDFAAFEGKEAPKEKAAFADDPIRFGKKLYRDTDDVMLAGVASGIARYIGVEPWIVRAAFAASVLFGGAGVVIYVILWIVIPEAKTIGDKAEMRGGKLTIGKIEATLREKVPEATKNIDKGKLKQLIDVPFSWIRTLVRFAGRVLGGVLPFLVRLFGVLLSAAAMLGLLFLSFWFIVFMTGSWEQYMDIPVRQLAGDAVFYVTVVCAYLILLIPGIIVFGIGTSLSKMKNDFGFASFMTLAGVWMTALLVGAAVATGNGPAFVQKVEAYVEEFRTETTKDIPLVDFTDIEASHQYRVRIRKGGTFTMKAVGSERSIERLRTSVEKGTLKIWQEGRGSFCILCLDNDATIDITTPSALGNVTSAAGAAVDVDGIAVNGDSVEAVGGAKIDIHNSTLPRTVTLRSTAGSRVSADSARTIDALTLDAAAGGRLEYAGNATTVKADANAGARIVLQGSGTTLNASVNAGGRLEASGFGVTDADLNVSSGGRAEVKVSGRLTGSAHAGGVIRYAGEPASVTVDTDPSGHAEALND